MTKTHKGMTLIEVLVALSLLAIVLVSSTAIFAFTFSETMNAGEISQQTYSSREDMEENMKDGKDATNASYNLFADDPGLTGSNDITSRVMGTTYVTNLKTKVKDSTGLKWVDSDVQMAAFKALKSDTRISGIQVTNKNGGLISDPYSKEATEDKAIYKKAMEDILSYEKALSTIYGNPRKSISITLSAEKLAGFTISFKVVDKSGQKPSEGLSSFEIIDKNPEKIGKWDSMSKTFTVNDSVPSGAAITAKFTLNTLKQGQFEPGLYRFILSYTKNGATTGEKDELDKTIVPYNVSDIRVIAGTSEGLFISSDGKTFYETDERKPVTAVAYGGQNSPVFVMATKDSVGPSLKFSPDGLNWKSVDMDTSSLDWLKASETGLDNATPTVKKIVYGGPIEEKVFMAITNNRIFVSYDNDNTKDKMKWGVIKGISTPYNGGGSGKFGLTSNNAMKETVQLTDIDIKEPELITDKYIPDTETVAVLSYKDEDEKNEQADYMYLFKTVGPATTYSLLRYGKNGKSYDKIVSLNFNVSKNHKENDQVLLLRDVDSVASEKEAIMATAINRALSGAIKGVERGGTPEFEVGKLNDMTGSGREVNMIEVNRGQDIFMYLGGNKWSYINCIPDEKGEPKFRAEKDSKNMKPIKEISESTDYQVRDLTTNQAGDVIALVGKKKVGVSPSDTEKGGNLPGISVDLPNSLYLNDTQIYKMVGIVEGGRAKYDWQKVNDQEYVSGNTDLYINLSKYDVSDVVWR